MLLSAELIESLADTLEGLVVGPIAADHPSSNYATVLLFHTGGKSSALPEAPILEVVLSERKQQTNVSVQSALGIIEFQNIAEVRLLESTREAAFYSGVTDGRISLLTVSSRGILQCYMNIREDLATSDFSELPDDELKGAVALKVFSENVRTFNGAVESSQ